MIHEARLDETEYGLRPSSEGWHVVNAGAAAWRRTAAVPGRWRRGAE